MKKQWAVKLLLIWLSLYAWEVSAANYTASITRASYANGYITVNGYVNYNPGGVWLPESGNDACPGSAKCRYLPFILYRYDLISGGKVYPGLKGKAELNDLTIFGFKNELQNSYSPTNFNLLVDVMKNTFGNTIAINRTVQSIKFDATRVLQDVGICMVTQQDNTNARNDYYDLNSCSWIKPTVSCSIQNSLLLDHGSLKLGNVNGNQKMGNVNISCSGSLSAKVFLLDNTINLTSGLVSKITINGKSTEQTIPLTVGNNTISVESTLVDSGAQAGSFQGSTTLVVSYQ